LRLVRVERGEEDLRGLVETEPFLAARPVQVLAKPDGGFRAGLAVAPDAPAEAQHARSPLAPHLSRLGEGVGPGIRGASVGEADATDRRERRGAESEEIESVARRRENARRFDLEREGARGVGTAAERDQAAARRRFGVDRAADRPELRRGLRESALEVGWRSSAHSAHRAHRGPEGGEIGQATLVLARGRRIRRVRLEEGEASTLAKRREGARDGETDAAQPTEDRDRAAARRPAGGGPLRGRQRARLQALLPAFETAVGDGGGRARGGDVVRQPREQALLAPAAGRERLDVDQLGDETRDLLRRRAARPEDRRDLRPESPLTADADGASRHRRPSGLLPRLDVGERLRQGEPAPEAEIEQPFRAIVLGSFGLRGPEMDDPPRQLADLPEGGEQLGVVVPLGGTHAERPLAEPGET